MKFQFMKKHSSAHCIKTMAKVLEVSRSGYYAWLNRPISNRSLENESLLVLIKDIWERTNKSYGSIRIAREIKKSGFESPGHNRIARIMRRNDIRAIRTKKWKTPKEEKNLTIEIANVLDRKFRVDEPNKVWVSDITYIRTTSGWYYHCAIMDLFNREIIGRSFGNKMDVDFVLEAFSHALENRGNPRGVLFHTDRGSQYCSNIFRKVLALHGFQQSLSRRGNCWDNACIESFFKSLKYEWLYPAGKCSPKEMELLIFEYIEGFYNRTRLHSALGYISPVDYMRKKA